MTLIRSAADRTRVVKEFSANVVQKLEMNCDAERAFPSPTPRVSRVVMPQLEHAIRDHLEMAGAVVSTLPTSGEQNELDLGALLELPEASKLVG